MTKIEWADITINPVVGCKKCSPGCDNCYAERFAQRMIKHPNKKIQKKYANTANKGGWTGESGEWDFSVFDNLPKSPRKIFIGSMTDLFIEERKTKQGFWPAELYWIMAATKRNPQHTFMMLTKRPEAMKDFVESWEKRLKEKTPQNIWIGVTVCNQEEADKQIPILLATPAAKRFVSVEPLLGSVDLQCLSYDGGVAWIDALNGTHGGFGPHGATNEKVDWVICGGETGPGARPVHPDWVRSLRDQCVSAGVPFFFKSWGEWIEASEYNIDASRQNFFLELDGTDSTKWTLDKHTSSTAMMVRLGKKKTRNLLDGRERQEVPR